MNYDANTDIDHFNNLQPPLSPNEQEVEIYRQFTETLEPTLLLGYTKQLLPLCDYAMDLNPPDEPRYNHVIQQNWFDIPEHTYDTIIGDGVLNLVGGELVQYLSGRCNTLVIRFFTKKLPNMKYATQYRHNTNFLLPDEIIETQPNCKILIWRFKD
jgi:hypothetical protein